MKDKNDNTVRISVRLSEGEKELLERSAKLCGLSQSEFENHDFISGYCPS